MNKKKKILIAIGALTATATVTAGAVLLGLNISKKPDMSWKEKGYDLSLPVLDRDGWYMVFEDDFDGDGLNQNIKFGENYKGSREIWTTSPHAIRWKSDDESKPENACWWCPDMVEVKNSKVYIHTRFEENHTCDGECPKTARFTSGIETRRIAGDNNQNKGTADEILFSQAFGYFECRVKLPKSDGLWSAFWLQSSNMRKYDNAGEDGTEIDIYESAFKRSRKSKMGHALLWNGYGKHGEVSDYIGDLEQDLYDGFHTFALKWTPEYYVFYIDGKPTWATADGGVSKVREFLRLTVETDAGDGWGPHGQKIGKFSHDNSKNEDFIIDYVKVWQNSSYEKSIREDESFEGTLELN